MIKEQIINRALFEREQLWSFVSEWLSFEADLVGADRDVVDEFIDDVKPDVYKTNQLLRKLEAE